MAISEDDITKNPIIHNLIEALGETSKALDDPVEYLIPTSGEYPEDQAYHPFSLNASANDPGLGNMREMLQKLETPANVGMNVGFGAWGVKKLLPQLMKLLKRKKPVTPPTKAPNTATTQDVRDALAEHKQLRQQMNEVPFDMPDIVPLHDYSKIARQEALQKSIRQYERNELNTLLNQRGNSDRPSFVERRLKQMRREGYEKMKKELDDLLRDD